MPKRPRVWLSTLGLLAVVFLAAPIAAQDVGTHPPEEERLKLNILDNLLGPPDLGEKVSFFGSFTVERGSRRGTLTVLAQIEPEWHIYSITQPDGATQRTRLEPAKSADYKLLGPFQPDRAPEIKRYEYYKVNVEEHAGQVAWHAPIEIAAGVKPAALTINVKASAQVCKNSCIDVNADVDAAFSGYTEPAKTPGEYHPPASEAQVVLKGHIEPAAVAPGGKAKLVLTAVPNAGWHLYAYAAKDPDQVGVNKPTIIYLTRIPGWQYSSPTASVAPKTKAASQPGMPAERYHDEPVSWTIDVAVPADSPPGEMVLTGYVGFQTCKEGCLPPHATQFRVALPVAESQAAGTIPLEFLGVQSSADSPSAAGSPVKGYRDVANLVASQPGEEPETQFSLPVLIALGLVGGFILNLMPCVFPVIGLKILSFAQQGGQSKTKVLALNLSFVAGILAVFLALATAAAFANQLWGEQLTYQWFKVTMIVIVFAMALSFLGVWELPMPGIGGAGSSDKAQKQEGIGGAFFKGIFTTLLATPCSGPLLGSLFTYCATVPPVLSYVIFLSIGLGMGSPYLAVALVPSLIRWLPKPGPWMDTFKQSLAFLLLATVVYLFMSVDKVYFIPTLALVMGVWFACWLIGRVPVYEAPSKQIWAWVAGCAAAALVGYASFYYLGPKDEKTKLAHLAWQPYTEQALSRVQSEGKTVLLDFTANWCLTCQYNSKFAIDTPKVKALVEKNNVVPMIADWTNPNPEIKEKLLELNSRSIPLLVIYPAGDPAKVIILRDLVTEGQVVTALEKAGPSKPTAKPAAAGTSETAMANP